MSLGVLDRIIDNIVLNPDTGCIEWTGPDNGGGYGRLNVGRKLVYTHRLSYELAFGVILTACVKAGHPFDESNTYVTPAGARACRACRTCKRLNEARYRAQRKAARSCR